MTNHGKFTQKSTFCQQYLCNLIKTHMTFFAWNTRNKPYGFKTTNKYLPNYVLMIIIDIILSFDYEVLKETHHNTADQ